MRLFQAGYPVPEGFILTTSFFEPWLTRLQRTPAWEEFLGADPANLSSICQRLQQIIEDCRLSLDQQTILTEQLSHWQTDMSLAVRSSSPEEDLQRASFAGAYRTILGVKASQVHAVLPAIVSSSLDHGLVLYKQNRGIDPRGHAWPSSFKSRFQARFQGSLSRAIRSQETGRKSSSNRTGGSAL